MAITGKRAPKGRKNVDAVTAAAVESIRDEIEAGNIAVEDVPPAVQELLAPEGTALPETVVDQPVQPDNAAAQNQEPIVVLTKEQTAAQKLMNRDIFLKWYAKRPQTARWVEPTEDQRNERIGKLMAERGVKPTDFLKLAGLAAEVEQQIASERAASGIDAAVASDIAYLRAAQNALNDLSSHISTMLGELGVKQTTTTRKAASSAPRATSSTVTKGWKEKNPKLIAYAKELGLKDCVLVDTASSGYEGSFHVLRVCEDGRFEECDYDAATMKYTPRGVFHDSPIYFQSAAGERPKYSPAQMFNVLLGKAIPGVSINVKNVDKPFADLAIFSKAAGI